MLFLLLVVHALALAILGKNDWSKACLDGTCSYDIEQGPTSMGGAIEIVSLNFSMPPSSFHLELVRLFVCYIGHHPCCRMVHSELLQQYEQSDD